MAYDRYWDMPSGQRALRTSGRAGFPGDPYGTGASNPPAPDDEPDWDDEPDEEEADA